MRKALIMGAFALTVLVTACGSKTDTSTAPTTNTAAPASSTTEKDKSDKTTTTEGGDDEETTTTKKGKTTTTEGDDEETTTTSKKKAPTKIPVTKPSVVEKVDKSKLPSTSTADSDFELTTEEEDCVDTVLYEYVSDESNAQDDATLAGVQGGAIAVCVDSQKIAVGIVAGIKAKAPELTDDQAACLENEIAGSSTDDLAVFLGAFIYEGPEADDLQQPFIEALAKACDLG